MGLQDMNYFKTFGHMCEDDDDEQITDLEALPEHLHKSKSKPKPPKSQGNVLLTSWSSAFIANKPQLVQERVVKLFSLQQKYTSLIMQYQEEALDLEQKYLALMQPLYVERRETITGLRETISKPPLSPMDGDGGVGIPNFWLQAMKNEPSLADLIAPRDEAVLAELKDIRLENLPNGERGFILMFTFGENEYFWNQMLTKTYMYIRAADAGDDAVEDIYSTEYSYHESYGDAIHWKDGRNLIEREDEDGEQNESFFTFFAPPTKPDGEDGEAKRTYDWLLELDFGYGEVFKEKVIPYAVHWYTGEATLYEDLNEDESSDGDDENDGSEEESEEEDSENE